MEEKITGIILKQCSFNAYIDLEKIKILEDLTEIH